MDKVPDNIRELLEAAGTVEDPNEGRGPLAPAERLALAKTAQRVRLAISEIVLGELRARRDETGGSDLAQGWLSQGLIEGISDSLALAIRAHIMSLALCTEKDAEDEAQTVCQLVVAKILGALAQALFARKETR